MLTLTSPDPRLRQINYRPSQTIVNLFTSTTAAGVENQCIVGRYADWTHGAAIESVAENPIAEFKRISGLTWEQVAQAIGVDRRTLHFWEAGRPMRPKHQERLQRALRIVRRADRGDAASTRQCLLDASGGPILKDLLANGAFDEAMRRVEALPPVPPKVKPSALSSEARKARRGPLLAQKPEVTDSPVSIPRVGPGRPAKITRVGSK